MQYPRTDSGGEANKTIKRPPVADSYVYYSGECGENCKFRIN